MSTKRQSKPAQRKPAQHRGLQRSAAHQPPQADHMVDELSPAEACMSAQPERLQRLHASQQQVVLRQVQQVRGNQHVQRLAAAPGARRQATASGPIGTATVTASVLNVRQGPSQTAARIGRLRRSQQVPVLSRQGEWLRIRFGDGVAFIHGDYATFRPRPAQPQQAPGLLEQAGDVISSGVQQVGEAVNTGVKQAGTLLGELWDSTRETAGELLGGSRAPAPAQAPHRRQAPAAAPRRAGQATQERNPNAILSELETGGASAATARQDGHRAGGVESSQKMAQRDFNALRQYVAVFIEVGEETGLPPALLAAIASRESRGGTQLDRRGYGDHGNGFGLMQVDKRYHELAGGAHSKAHITQAARILKSYLEQVAQKFPRWSEAQQLRGAVAAYNFGVKNVQSWNGLDSGTTGDDYSADVWARARYYGGLPEFSQGSDLVATTPTLPAAQRRRPQQPGPQAGAGRDTSNITISFGPNAEASVVSAYTLQVLKECLAAAGERSATITSTSRDPYNQARVMYDNLNRPGGVAAQHRLYGRYGDQVIDTYVASKAAGKDRGQIIADMEAKIREIGPSRVSKHCADPAVLGVFDVSPGSIQNDARFVAAVSADERVSNFLHPGNSDDPAYHIEIPQR